MLGADRRVGRLDAAGLLRHVDRGGLAVPGLAHQRRLPVGPADRFRPDRHLRRRRCTGPGSSIGSGGPGTSIGPWAGGAAGPGRTAGDGSGRAPAPQIVFTSVEGGLRLPVPGEVWWCASPIPGWAFISGREGGLEDPGRRVIFDERLMGLPPVAGTGSPRSPRNCGSNSSPGDGPAGRRGDQCGREQADRSHGHGLHPRPRGRPSPSRRLA